MNKKFLSNINLSISFIVIVLFFGLLSCNSSKKEEKEPKRLFFSSLCNFASLFLCAEVEWKVLEPMQPQKNTMKRYNFGVLRCFTVKIDFRFTFHDGKSM